MAGKGEGLQTPLYRAGRSPAAALVVTQFGLPVSSFTRLKGDSGTSYSSKVTPGTLRSLNSVD